MRTWRRPIVGSPVYGLRRADDASLQPRGQRPHGRRGKALASFLKLDNISYVLRATVYARKEAGRDGRPSMGGLIKRDADLDQPELPNPCDDALYILTGRSVADRVCRMGFDVFASTDDMAFNADPFFSPAVFRSLVLSWYRRVAEKITLSWIIHSVGSILPFMDDLISVGVIGLHSNKKGAVDIREVKRTYGDTVFVLGNVDLNLLGMGDPETVEREVHDLVRDMEPGGGYIVTSSNSLAGYLLPDKVTALSRAVEKYGRYPISL